MAVLLMDLRHGEPKDDPFRLPGPKVEFLSIIYTNRLNHHGRIRRQDGFDRAVGAGIQKAEQSLRRSIDSKPKG